MKQGRGHPGTRAMPELSLSEIDRFHLTVTKGLHDDCWPWQGRRLNGYGHFYLDNNEWRLAHRVALFLSTSEDRPDLMTLHRCNNNPCCNPKHLYAGTGLDNANDRIDAGTQMRGEDHGRSILTESDVLEIQMDIALRRKSERQLAKHFNVARSTINAIGRGISWKHLYE